jgi:hypothetical protein
MHQDEFEQEGYKKYLRKMRIKNDLVLEMVLFLILGILIGFTIKTEATRKITMGFDDYRLKNSQQGYDIDTIQKVLFEKAKAQQEAAQQSAPAAGAPEGQIQQNINQ